MKTNYMLPIWENPETQEINRLSMRSPLLPFCSATGALVDAMANAIAGPEFRSLERNEYCLSLDGNWRFKLLNNPIEDCDPNVAIAGLDLPAWVAPSYDAGDWAELTVPGTWTRQG